MTIRTLLQNLVLLSVLAAHTVTVAQVAGSATETFEPPSSSLPTSLPNARDRELVMEACTRCHSIDMVTEQPRDPDEWLEVVSMMVARGMALTDDEYGRVIAYLSEHLASPVTEVETMAEPEKGLR